MGGYVHLPRAEVDAVLGVEVVAALVVGDAPRGPPPTTEHPAGNRNRRRAMMVVVNGREIAMVVVRVERYDESCEPS